MLKLTVLCVFIALAAATVDLNAPLESDNIIETVNAAKTTWRAGRNFHHSYKKSYLRNLLGVIAGPKENPLPELEVDLHTDVDDLPDTFDSRTQWSNCQSIQTLRDQGPCGSCWATAAASAFSDRMCIASNGAFNSLLAVEHLLSCCGFICGLGCNGGQPSAAWWYFKHFGIPTGGDYNSGEGCQPYTLPACEHHTTGARKSCDSYGEMSTPKCSKTCYNTNYTTPYSNDFHKVKSAYNIRGEKSMMKEIYTNGPIEASFMVYDDFLSYKSGVYHHTTGAYAGGHAVKIIGWGTEEDTPYWLVANSWNSDWGENGFFKIRRGKNECTIEGSCSAGIPIV